jgi:hypothetical protein
MEDEVLFTISIVSQFYAFGNYDPSSGIIM